MQSAVDDVDDDLKLLATKQMLVLAEICEKANTLFEHATEQQIRARTDFLVILGFRMEASKLQKGQLLIASISISA